MYVFVSSGSSGNRGLRSASANQPKFFSHKAHGKTKCTVFYSGIKGKVCLIFAKAAALRMDVTTDGSLIAMDRKGKK